MLDIKLVRDNPDLVDKACESRQNAHWDRARFFELDEERRSAIAEVESLQADRNTASKAIGQLMGELDSEPRPSLGGLTPVAMLRAAYGPLAEDLMDALGVEDVPYEELDLTLRAVEAERRERGEAPLL